MIPIFVWHNATTSTICLEVNPVLDSKPARLSRINCLKRESTAFVRSWIEPDRHSSRCSQLDDSLIRLSISEKTPNQSYLQFPSTCGQTIIDMKNYLKTRIRNCPCHESAASSGRSMSPHPRAHTRKENQPFGKWARASHYSRMASGPVAHTPRPSSPQSQFLSPTPLRYVFALLAYSMAQKLLTYHGYLFILLKN